MNQISFFSHRNVVGSTVFGSPTVMRIECGFCVFRSLFINAQHPNIYFAVGVGSAISPEYWSLSGFSCSLIVNE